MTDMIRIDGLRVRDMVCISKWFNVADIRCIRQLDRSDYKTLFYVKDDEWIYCNDTVEFYKELLLTGRADNNRSTRSM